MADCLNIMHEPEQLTSGSACFLFTHTVLWGVSKQVDAAF